MDHYKLWDNLAFIFKFTNNRQLLLSVIDFLDTLINLNCREITENLISNGKNLVIGLSQFECYPDVFDDNDSEVWTFKYHLSNIFQCLSSSEDGCNIFSEIGFDLRNSIIESVLKPFRKLMQEQRVGEAPQNHDIWCLTASLSLLLWLGKIIETAEETPMKILRGIEIDFEKLEFNDDELKHVCYETLRKLTE
uniref:Uncharacterized protein n=1 Tax=Romanomermis culicivorax TaxID=13658 RepID=A0A915K5E2_ROMCU